MTQRIRQLLPGAALHGPLRAALGAPTERGRSGLPRRRARRRTALLGVFIPLCAALWAPSAAAVCTPDTPMDGDTVVCTDEVSTGYDVSGANDLDITIEGDSMFDDTDFGTAIQIGDETSIDIGTDVDDLPDPPDPIPETIIDVTQDDGVGIQGDDNNFINNNAIITLDGERGRGIKIGDNTTGILPNGAVNDDRGRIIAEGDDSIAMETGTNSGVATRGRIELNGARTRGISAGSRVDLRAAANITNLGTIEVNGADGYGITAGDDWIDGSFNGGIFTPNAAGIRNQGGGTIEVNGDRSFGIFAGDDANVMGDHNSFVINNTGSTIDVTGTDAIGISVGGNDRLDPDDPTVNTLRTLENFGTIRGGANAGPLIEIRNFVDGFQNRILNGADGDITADLTFQGIGNRAMAILASGGEDLVQNLGDITGDIALGAGDDIYVHDDGASLSGSVFGDAGDDQLFLTSFTSAETTPAFFDLMDLDQFETVSIFGGGARAWELGNTATFMGVTEILPGGRLTLPLGTAMGGELRISDGAELTLGLDGVTTPLTVGGSATFAGTLVVDADVGLSSDATYRVIDVQGSPSGRFSAVQVEAMFGRAVGKPVYDSTGVGLLVSSSLEILARGATQRSIAAHLTAIDGVTGTGPDLQSLIDDLYSSGISPAAAENIFSALSPEAYDAHTTIVVEGGRQIANLLFDRPRECQPGEPDRWRSADTPLPCHSRKWSPWLAATGSFRSRDGFDGHPRYDAQLGGAVFGIDARPLAGLDLTFAISSQRGQINVSGAEDSTVTLVDVSGHAAWRQGPLRVQGVAGWGHGFHQDRRRILFSEPSDPAVRTETRGDTDHDSDRITLAGEAGYLIDVGPVQIEPIIGVDWAWVNQRTIDENNAAFGFGVLIPGRDDDVGSVSGGFRLSTTYDHQRYLAPQLEWMDGVWRPMIDIRWRQLVEGDQRNFSARFDGTPDGAPDFQVQGEEDSGGLEISAGLSFIPEIANRLQFDFRYEAYVSENTLQQDLVARVMLGF